ncbi:methionine--tRNA ligase [Nocardia nova]
MTTRYLVTSALPYINGIKHLGNLVGSMLPADVYARFRRARGDEILFVCATDEHGTPAELAADAAGLSVEEFCRRQHHAQAEVYQAFGLSFDVFGRSSSEQNRVLTQHFGRALADNGYLQERLVKQVYSIADGRFLPDRYVVGICPYCGFNGARGDQCENCTRLLDPTELIDPRSAVSDSSELEVRETRHLYLLQSRLAEWLRDWVTTRENWPNLVTSIALKWLDEGLEDRSITRDLHWGVPVDRAGFEDKVYYVWFDAPIEYISATKEWADQSPTERDWRSWWYDTDDVTYIQFMAKDNIPFHSIMFPGIIRGTGEPWKQVDYIKGFNWLNYYGGKFSTSRGHGIFMDAALELLPADYWRYYLMANAPESDDVSFTWELFAATVNKDLADVLGNFVNRVLTFVHKRYGDTLPPGGTPGDPERELGLRLVDLLREYEEYLETFQFRKAAATVRSMWSLGNEYVNDRAPWSQIKTDPTAAAQTLRTSANLIYLFSLISEPLIPNTARVLRELWEVDTEPTYAWPTAEDTAALNWLEPGTAFALPPVLFRKISEDDIVAWRARFG